jgi:hypothetical protein
MAEFGGEDEEMQRHRLLGWACYIAAVEPDLGYPLLRAFDELVPAGYDTSESVDVLEDLDDLP